MPQDGPPGEPRDVAVEVTGDLGTQRTPTGFLHLHCLQLRRTLPDGSLSEPFHYDVVERRSLDAVVILLLRPSDRGVEVCLRSQLRVPLAFRSGYDVPDADLPTNAVLWELPAGLIEPGEIGVEGIAYRASQETLEETGYALAPGRFTPFGTTSYPTPGLVAEKFHFVQAELTEADRPREAEGDGHVVELGSELQFVELQDALRAVDAGQIPDLKTEVALRRLWAFREQAR